MPSLTQTYEIDDLPILEKVKDGSPVKLVAVGKVSSKDGNSVVIDWSQFDLETENRADKELKTLTHQNEKDEQNENIKSGDSFF